jgi:hypothetical protein
MSQDIETGTYRVARLMADLETQLQTDVAVLQSIVRGTDPDSPDGRRAQQMLAAFGRMMNDLSGAGA